MLWLNYFCFVLSAHNQIWWPPDWICPCRGPVLVRHCFSNSKAYYTYIIIDLLLAVFLTRDCYYILLFNQNTFTMLFAAFYWPNSCHNWQGIIVLQHSWVKEQEKNIWTSFHTFKLSSNCLNNIDNFCLSLLPTNLWPWLAAMTMEPTGRYCNVDWLKGKIWMYYWEGGGDGFVWDI